MELCDTEERRFKAVWARAEAFFFFLKSKESHSLKYSNVSASVGCVGCLFFVGCVQIVPATWLILFLVTREDAVNAV